MRQKCVSLRSGAEAIGEHKALKIRFFTTLAGRWPNGQGVGLRSRRFQVRVLGGSFSLHWRICVPFGPTVACLPHFDPEGSTTRAFCGLSPCCAEALTSGGTSANARGQKRWRLTPWRADQIGEVRLYKKSAAWMVSPELAKKSRAHN